MIAEKILDEKWSGYRFAMPVTIPNILAAMQSYADFFYWLGKEGWVKGVTGMWVNSMYQGNLIKTESDLYETYLTNSKPKK